jgi:hypothetical protein
MVSPITREEGEMRTRTITALLAASLALAGVGVASASSGVDVAARSFANCTALNRVYKHGVGKWGARDHTSGTRVTTFKRSNALYRANDGMDRDGDGIACEKL